MSEAFWAFSLQFYAAAGVAGACLELQDNERADVNLLLLALWAASMGRELDAAAIAAAERVAKPWRESVTEPLRAARRALKQPPEGFAAESAAALKGKVQALEIEAERLQQDAMARGLTLGAKAEPRTAARANLRRYEAFLGGNLAPASLVTLLDAFDRTQAKQEEP
ncbi:MAG: TIGR02444 family protein, partial [Acetobacteraceae bacterium]